MLPQEMAVLTEVGEEYILRVKLIIKVSQRIIRSVGVKVLIL